MSVALRIALIIGAVALAVFVVAGVRKSRMRIEDSLFWVGLSLLILVLSIFPDLGIWCADLLGVQSPVNFVLLFFIAVLLVKCFLLARQVSQLENKTKELAQRVAVDRLEHYEREGGTAASEAAPSSPAPSPFAEGDAPGEAER